MRVGSGLLGLGFIRMFEVDFVLGGVPKIVVYRVCCQLEGI